MENENNKTLKLKNSKKFVGITLAASCKESRRKGMGYV